MKITFLGIGVQKAATSTLHDILKQHSQIYLPEKKESHFFDIIERYSKGVSWLYESFSNYDNQQQVGKFTPEYIYLQEVPERIAETLGKNIKFIIVFRNPVDRAVSDYNMMHGRGIEKDSFWKAIENEPEKIKKSFWNRVSFSYLSRGLYAKQLERYLEIFPIENFLFLIFEEDIRKNLAGTIVKIQNFLEVPYEELNCDIKSNEAFVPKSLTINRLIRNSRWIKRLLSPLLPSAEVRKKMVERVYKWNKKSQAGKAFTISKADKQILFEKHFKEETERLEKLTGMSFKKYWSHE